MPAGDATLAVQAAVVAALRAAPAVAAEVGARVYDRPPDPPTYPFVSVGPTVATPFEAAGMDGWDLAITLDTWSRAAGAVECRRIMAAVAGALHGAALTVAGHKLVWVRLIDARTVEEDVAGTTHGVQRFQVVTHL